ncbi:MAG: hypothetical protein HY507_00980 [Candidatus Zambryskibacteria bacterium]|nr:hypothetical protein [Candidatus Zambryskibacteria bacterium]
MIIGFDLDDVLLNFQDTMRVYHNETYGTKDTLEDSRVWNLWERWNCTPEESVRRLKEFFEHPSHYNVVPLPGSVEAVQELKKNHTLVIVSAKPENLKQRTFEWLDKYFPNSFAKVIFTRPHYDPNKRKKSEVCKELGIEVFIEDAPHNAEDVASAGIPVLLFDWPWNQVPLPERVTRVFSWPEIIERLNQ